MLVNFFDIVDEVSTSTGSRRAGGGPVAAQPSCPRIEGGRRLRHLTETHFCFRKIILHDIIMMHISPLLPHTAADLRQLLVLLSLTFFLFLLVRRRRRRDGVSKGGAKAPSANIRQGLPPELLCFGWAEK